MELIDTHTHLGDAHFAADRAAVIAASKAAGVTRMIEIADNFQEWDRALALAEANPGFACAWGFHPHYGNDWTDAVPAEFKKRAASPLIKAVGEIGLDYVKSMATRTTQEKVFRKMLRLAQEVDKPIVIHCREAFDDLFRILEEEWKPGTGVVHCFTGGEAEAARALENKLLLGVDGPVTYKKNDDLRAAFKLAGLENLVLETDCPYLPPQSIRGKRNTPASIPEIAAKLAEVFDVSVEEVARVTSENARKLFSL